MGGRMMIASSPVMEQHAQPSSSSGPRTLNQTTRSSRSGLRLEYQLSTVPHIKQVMGRDAALEEIGEKLQKGPVYLTGMAGVGKTQLALEFAARNKAKYCGVFWLRAGGRQLEVEYLALGAMLGVERVGWAAAAPAGDAVTQQRAMVRGVKKALEAMEGRCLLVLDDVEEEEGLWEMIPSGPTAGAPVLAASSPAPGVHLGTPSSPTPGVQVVAPGNRSPGVQGVHLASTSPGVQGKIPGGVQCLITTRRKKLAGSMQRVMVDCLEMEEAVALVSGWQGFAGKEEDAVRGLAKELGYHTFALAICGRLLARRQVRPSELLARMKEAAGNVAGGKIGVGGSEAVGGVQILNGAAEGEASRSGAEGAVAKRGGVREVPEGPGEVDVSSPGEVSKWREGMQVSTEREEVKALEGKVGVDMSQDWEQVAVSAGQLEGKACHNGMEGQQANDAFHSGPNVAWVLETTVEAMAREAEVRERVRDLAIRVLKVAGWFGAAPIPLDLLGLAAQRLGHSGPVSPIDEKKDGLLRAVGLLVEYGLAERDKGGSVTVHPLVQEFARAVPSAGVVTSPQAGGRGLGGGQGAAGRAMVYALTKAGSVKLHREHFQNACQLALGPGGVSGQQLCLDRKRQDNGIQRLALALGQYEKETLGAYSSALELAELCLRQVIEDESKERKGRKASINSTQGCILDGNGRSVDSEEMHVRSVSVREAALGIRHPDTTVSLNSLVPVPQQQGELSEAKEMDSEGLQIRKAGHTDTALTPSNLADVLRQQGKVSEAEEIHRRSVQVLNKDNGSKDLDAAGALGELGDLLLQQGKLAEAEEMYRRSLQTREHVQGAQHPDTARSLNNLGTVLQKQGQLVEAEAMYRKCLRVRERMGQVKHTDTATFLSNLGSVLHQQGKLSEAEEVYRRGLGIREEVLGGEHPGTVTAIGHLAEVLKELGKLREAEEMWRRSLEVRQRVLGAHNPETAASMGHLALVLSQQGKLREAEEVQRRSVEVLEELLGSDHPDTASALNNLADVLRQQGNVVEAGKLWKRSLEVRERVLGPKHPDTAASLANMALVLAQQGRLGEAEEMHRRSLDVRVEVLGPKHADTAAALNNLGLVLQQQGRLREAEQMHRWSLGIREEVLGAMHADTASSLNSLGTVLKRQGRLAEAEEMCRRGLEIREKVLGLNHPDTARSLGNVANVLKLEGKVAEAEEMYRRSLGAREEVLGAKHPDTAISCNNLGSVLYLEGKLGEAEEMHRRGLEIREKVLGGDHPDTAESMWNLSRLLQSQGQVDEALDLARHSHEVFVNAFGPDCGKVQQAKAVVVQLERMGRRRDFWRGLFCLSCFSG